MQIAGSYTRRYRLLPGPRPNSLVRAVFGLYLRSHKTSNKPQDAPWGSCSRPRRRQGFSLVGWSPALASTTTTNITVLQPALFPRGYESLLRIARTFSTILKRFPATAGQLPFIFLVVRPSQRLPLRSLVGWPGCHHQPLWSVWVRPPRQFSSRLTTATLSEAHHPLLQRV